MRRAAAAAACLAAAAAVLGGAGALRVAGVGRLTAADADADAAAGWVTPELVAGGPPSAFSFVELAAPGDDEEAPERASEESSEEDGGGDSSLKVHGKAASTSCIPGSRLIEERCPVSGLKCPLKAGVCCITNPHYCCPEGHTCMSVLGEEDRPVRCVKKGNYCDVGCQTEGTRTEWVAPVCGSEGAKRFPAGTVEAAATTGANEKEGVISAAVLKGAEDEERENSPVNDEEGEDDQ